MGIMMMMLGVLLTINQAGVNNEFLIKIRKTLEVYWPLILSFIGIYMISFPKKKNKR